MRGALFALDEGKLTLGDLVGGREPVDDERFAVRLGLRMVRGLDYYTRTTFEFDHPLLGAQSGIGGGGRRSFLDRDQKEWREMLATNLDGAVIGPASASSGKAASSAPR